MGSPPQYVKGTCVAISSTSLESARPLKKIQYGSKVSCRLSERGSQRLWVPAHLLQDPASMPMIHVYAEKIVGGEIFPESKEENDDPLQMGGDFTLSRSGHILLSHKSSNPYDRPSLHQILDAAAVKKTS